MGKSTTPNRLSNNVKQIANRSLSIYLRSCWLICGPFILIKLKKTSRPNIYECKIYGEHHCEHDFPEEQYFLSQELSAIIQPKVVLEGQKLQHHQNYLRVNSDKKDIDRAFQNLRPNERISLFGLLTSGSAMGTLLTGALGSFMLDYWSWPIVFQIMELKGLLWALGLRSFVKSKDKAKVINISLQNRLSLIHCTQISAIVWLRLFRKSCEMNCFCVLLSRLPSYFHENFPSIKGWIVRF